MKQTTFCAILLLATGCTSPKKTHTADPLRVGTIVVTPSSDIDAALYVGTIEEETSAALSFPVAGTVARTYADEGQRVQQGQLLAELDPTSARQTFDAAQAALDQAKDACARLKQLYDAESLPQIKWVEAQTRLRQAESAYGIARKNLDDCKLYAPFTGVIGKRQAAAGETVLPGVPAMTLLRIGTVKVRFPVPEQEIARLGTDSRLRITVAALGDRAFPAGRSKRVPWQTPPHTPMTYAPRCPTPTASCSRAWYAAWRHRRQGRPKRSRCRTRRAAGRRRKPLRMESERGFGRPHGCRHGTPGEQRRHDHCRNTSGRPHRDRRDAENRPGK